MAPHVMRSDIGSKIAIVGIGRVIALKSDERKTPLQLGAAAAFAAMRQAGIERRDVGALFTGRAPIWCCNTIRHCSTS